VNALRHCLLDPELCLVCFLEQIERAAPLLLMLNDKFLQKRISLR
jgi:hypothetical protein